MIETLKPELVSVQLEEDARDLAKDYPEIQFTFGAKGLVEVATHPDSTVLVNAVLGSVGLESTLAAIRMGKTIAIANKETLVTAGHLVMAEAKNIRPRFYLLIASTQPSSNQ